MSNFEPCSECTSGATCLREGCQRPTGVFICCGACRDGRACAERGQCARDSDGYMMHFDEAEHLETGAIRSVATGKGRYDLIPPAALRRLAVVYERGGEQKGDNNWALGIPRSRLLSSAVRHIYQAAAGETDEDHLAQAAWNLFAAIHFEETGLHSPADCAMPEGR